MSFDQRVGDTAPAASQLNPPAGIYALRIDRHTISEAKNDDDDDKVIFMLKLDQVLKIAEVQADHLETDNEEALTGCEVMLIWKSTTMDKFRRDFGNPLLSHQSALDASFIEYFSMLESLYGTEQNENYIILTLTRSILPSGMAFTNIRACTSATRDELNELINQAA